MKEASKVVHCKNCITTAKKDKEIKSREKSPAREVGYGIYTPALNG